jgi:hypothetical protein
VTSPYTPTANITLYAQWKKCTHNMEKLGCNGCSIEECLTCNYSTGICNCVEDACGICGVCEEHHPETACSTFVDTSICPNSSNREHSYDTRAGGHTYGNAECEYGHKAYEEQVTCDNCGGTGIYFLCISCSQSYVVWD